MNPAETLNSIISLSLKGDGRIYHHSKPIASNKILGSVALMLPFFSQFLIFITYLNSSSAYASIIGTITPDLSGPLFYSLMAFLYGTDNPVFPNFILFQFLLSSVVYFYLYKKIGTIVIQSFEPKPIMCLIIEGNMLYGYRDPKLEDQFQLETIQLISKILRLIFLYVIAFSMNVLKDPIIFLSLLLVLFSLIPSIRQNPAVFSLRLEEGVQGIQISKNKSSELILNGISTLTKFILAPIIFLFALFGAFFLFIFFVLIFHYEHYLYLTDLSYLTFRSVVLAIGTLVILNSFSIYENSIETIRIGFFDASSIIFQTPPLMIKNLANFLNDLLRNLNFSSEEIQFTITAPDVPKENIIDLTYFSEYGTLLITQLLTGVWILGLLYLQEILSNFYLYPLLLSFVPFVVHFILLYFFRDVTYIQDDLMIQDIKLMGSHIRKITKNWVITVFKEGTLFTMFDEERMKNEFKMFRERGFLDLKESLLRFIRMTFLSVLFLEVLVLVASNAFLVMLSILEFFAIRTDWNMVNSMSSSQLWIFIGQVSFFVFAVLHLLILTFNVIKAPKGFFFFSSNLPFHSQLKVSTNWDEYKLLGGEQ